MADGGEEADYSEQEGSDVQRTNLIHSTLNTGTNVDVIGQVRLLTSVRSVEEELNKGRTRRSGRGGVAGAGSIICVAVVPG